MVPKVVPKVVLKVFLTRTQRGSGVPHLRRRQAGGVFLLLLLLVLLLLLLLVVHLQTGDEPLAVQGMEGGGVAVFRRQGIVVAFHLTPM